MLTYFGAKYIGFTYQKPDIRTLIMNKSKKNIYKYFKPSVTLHQPILV